MPISLTSTPFYRFHFRPTLGQLSSNLMLIICLDNALVSATDAVFVKLDQNKTNTEAAMLSKSLSYAGKPCSGQICQQAYQPPRKVPGFSKLLELLNISIFVCLKLYFSFEVYPSVTFCLKYAWKTFPGVNNMFVKLV